MLEPPDSFHLAAAVGWLELGNPSEAEAELEKISRESRADEDVIIVRFNIHFSRENWSEADDLARLLIQKQPEVPSHWINLAYAVRRKPDGGIPEAKKILTKAAELFPSESLICYNLSCYESQLGDLAEAKNWFEKACRIGNRKQLQQMALNDPDLVPLRAVLNLFSVSKKERTGEI